MAGSRLLPLALALLLLARRGDSSVALAYAGVAFTLFREAISSETIHDPALSSPEITSDPSSPSPETTPEPTSTSLETISPLDSTTPNPGSASPEPETASLHTSGLPSSQPTTMSLSTNLASQGSPTASSAGQDAVLIAVRHSNREAPPSHNLDTVSLGSMRQRLPFADHLQH
ncbi:Predicted gene 3336 [Apodemus speciosus]|uniref:Predicted gene 3336 n=1 Tax=Apodemus speciosus TaxID=105296 RepID=A0ABQ0F1W7_APOSI